MAHRIEVMSKIPDMRAEVRRKKLRDLGFDVDVQIADVYTIDADLGEENLKRVKAMFCLFIIMINPVLMKA